MTEKTINYENSVNLDSTDCFEGPEKLLELWYAPDENSLPEFVAENGLRAIPQDEWENILDHVSCKILSHVKTSKFDSYVLSESSLFVYPHKVILKTCGTTTTLAGIAPLKEAVAEFVGYKQDFQPWRVFYSRKSFMFPDLQKHPHKSWSDEVEVLDGYFDNGSAYVVGNLKRDHWYLYATSPLYFDKNLKLPVNVNLSNSGISVNDQTLEILMTDLSPIHAGQFFTQRERDQNCHKDHYEGGGESDDSYGESSVSSLGAAADDDDPGHEMGNIVTKMTKIDQIYPTENQVIDSFCFSPCGYSCNGLLLTEGHYFTIHVTPEDGFSYASFETTVPPQQFGMTNLEVLEKVVGIFRPGKFSVTLFESEVETLAKYKLPTRLSNYKRTDLIRYDLSGYDLVFVSFELTRQ